MLSTFSQYFMTLSATENLAEKMVHLFGDTIPSWLTVFIISLFPILENRGGMIAARLLNMNMLQAFIISYRGSFRLLLQSALLFCQSPLSFSATRISF